MVYILIVAVAKLAMFWVFGLYRRVWKYASLKDMVAILEALLLASAIMVGIFYLLSYPINIFGFTIDFFFPYFPRSIFIIDFLLTLILIIISRYSVRFFSELKFGNPKTRKKKVLIVGAGPLREWGEWFVHAGSIGNFDMMNALVNWIKRNSTDELLLWEPLESFLDAQDPRYFQSRRFDPSRVIFTGFLDHVCLAPLLALAEWACFPSLVPESFGLVLVEAAACGVIPIATYFSGFKEILDQFKGILPGSSFPLLTLPFSGITIIPQLIENISKLIKLNPQISVSLRELAIQKFSWEQIAIQLEQIYSEISKNA